MPVPPLQLEIPFGPDEVTPVLPPPCADTRKRITGASFAEWFRLTNGGLEPMSAIDRAFFERETGR